MTSQTVKNFGISIDSQLETAIYTDARQQKGDLPDIPSSESCLWSKIPFGSKCAFTVASCFDPLANIRPKSKKNSKDDPTKVTDTTILSGNAENPKKEGE